MFNDSKGIQESIDTTKKAVEESRYFSASHYSTSVSNGGNLDLLVSVGNFPIHFKALAHVGNTCEVRVYENTTVSSIGTPVNVLNHNRIIPKTTTTTVSHTPTITNLGNALNGVALIEGGGTQPVAAIGNAGQNFDNKLILKPNTNYLVRVTNVSGNSIRVQNLVEFYDVGL